MDSDKKKKYKESFKRYMNAEKECKDPCLKNGKSDRYCLDCANEIMGDLLPNWKPTNELRQYYHKVRIDQFEHEMVTTLQQKWITETGKEEWREIPFVEEN